MSVYYLLGILSETPFFLNHKNTFMSPCYYVQESWNYIFKMLVYQGILVRFVH